MHGEPFLTPVPPVPRVDDSILRRPSLVTASRRLRALTRDWS